jgi:putative endonuclease
MFYFYVLQSHKDNDLYFGYTKALKRRVQEHNNGKVDSTRSRTPLELVYYEAYKSKEDACERERQIKRRARALIGLKRRIKNCIDN